jgi:formylmethanofuran dehydrogenase subunit D
MTEEHEHVELQLKVYPSKIKEPGGFARVNSDVLPFLKMEKGDEVEIHTEDEAILVTLTADKYLEKDTIHLRLHDMEKLEIKEGDDVYLTAHKTILDKLSELKDRIKSKFSKEDENDE